MKKLLLGLMLIIPSLAWATVPSATNSVTFNCPSIPSPGFPYPFTFPAFDAGSITVLTTNTVSGAQTTLSPVMDYTITPVNQSFLNGGTVVLSGLGCGFQTTVTIQRETEQTQNTQFTEYMPALYKNFEHGLDKLTMEVQDINYLRLLQAFCGNPSNNYVPFFNGTFWTCGPLPGGVAGNPAGRSFSLQYNAAGIFGGSGASVDSIGNINASLNRRINVKIYGATGDGTTNDYTAVTSAYAALVAQGGGTLVFPQTSVSYYLGANTFTITANNVTLEGDGPTASVINCSGNIPCVEASSVSNFSVANLGITSSFAQPGTSYNADFEGLVLFDVTHGIFDTVTVSNTFGGIVLFGGTDLKFHKVNSIGNYVIGFSGNAFGTAPYTPTTNLQMDGITISGTHDWTDIPNAVFTGSAHDFELSDTADFHITNAVAVDDGTLGQRSASPATSCFQFGPGLTSTVQNSQLQLTCINSANNQYLDALDFGGGYTKTATVTLASNQITVDSNVDLAVGQVVYYSGFPIGTTVTAISGTTITLSNNASSGAGSGLTVYFSGVYQNLDLKVQATGYRYSVSSNLLYPGITKNVKISGSAIQGTQSIIGVNLQGPLTLANNLQDITLDNFSVYCAGNTSLGTFGELLKFINGVKHTLGQISNCKFEAVLLSGASNNTWSGTSFTRNSQTGSGISYVVVGSTQSGIGSNNNNFTGGSMFDLQTSPTQQLGLVFDTTSLNNVVNGVMMDSNIVTQLADNSGTANTGVSAPAAIQKQLRLCCGTGTSGSIFRVDEFFNSTTDFQGGQLKPFGTTGMQLTALHAGTGVAQDMMLQADNSVFLCPNGIPEGPGCWQVRTNTNLIPDGPTQDIGEVANPIRNLWASGTLNAAGVQTNGPGPHSAQIGLNVFSALPACAGGTEGSISPVTDSTTATWGATITGSGTNHVLAYCDGSAWTVAGK